MIFTTSWDDGYVQDLALAAMLKKYGVSGTFYVCPAVQHGQTMLNDDQLRALDRDGFEIGSHTISHPRLTTKTDAEVLEEMRESKTRLEAILGRECTMFCYPKGDVDNRVATLAAKAGYRGARTVEQLQFGPGADPYQLPTSLHVYSFPWRIRYHRWWHFLDPLGPLRVKAARLRDIGTPLTAKRSWLALAKHLFTHAYETKQPVFHLWGHSEEVVRLGLQDDLDDFLAFVAEHEHIDHRTNGQVVAEFFPQKQ